MASQTLLALIAASAVLTIVSDAREWRRGVYVFKPLTTVLILALALVLPVPGAEAYRWMIVGGLVFSLAGDVFLMLPEDRFIGGLASFLVAHLCYIAAFGSRAGQPGDALFVLGILEVYGVVLMAVLWRHLRKLKAPVAVYAVVLLAMAWLAAEAWAETGGRAAMLAAVGAGLFVVSDSALALNRFRRPFAAAQAAVLSTYFAAQTLIALSVAAAVR